jgi:peptide/nickel transport system permease protein
LASTTLNQPTTKPVDLAPKGRSNTARFLRAFARNKVALLGLVIVTTIALGAVFADIIAPYDPIQPHYRERFQAPNASFLMGSDEIGRDIFSRLLYGARISLVIGFIAQGVAVTIGVTLGAISGWYGGWVDDVIMRLTDIFFAIPGLMFLIVWVTIFDTNTLTIFLALGLIGWPSGARMMRSQVLAIKNLDYITSAKALGAKTPRILFRHVLPNAVAPMIVLATLGIAGAILAESTLSFLGLGVQIPDPSWGTMVDIGTDYMMTAWWYAIFPGLAIMITVMGFNFIGDGLRDALDPTLYE